MSRRRRIAFGAGLVAALLVLAAAFFAHDLLIAYHVGVLRRDPGAMATWLKAPVDSLQGQALRAFLRTPLGLRALRGGIFAAVMELAVQEDARFIVEGLGAGRIVQFGLFELGKTHFLLVDGPRTLALALPAESEILAWGPLLESLGSGDFELQDHPGIRYTVWTYREDGGRGPLVVEGSLTRLPGEGASSP